MEKIDINDTGVVDGIRNKMAVATVNNKGLMSSTDKTALISKNDWTEFVEIGNRIGRGNSVLFSSVSAWADSELGTSYPSGIVTNKNDQFISVFCITGKSRQYTVSTQKWEDIM